MLKASLWRPLKFPPRMGQMLSSFSGEKWNFDRVLKHAEKTPEQLNAECPREYLIDVREVSEIRNTSAIPNAINIPCGSVETALKYPNSFSQFAPDRQFPDAQQDKLIFSCQSGMRAGRAASTALALGYGNVAVYPGSFSEWSSKIKQ